MSVIAMRKMPHYDLSDADKGYIAGYIDADGAIGITVRKSGPYLEPYVYIGGTDPRPIRYIARVLNAHATWTTPSKLSHGVLRQHHLQLGGGFGYALLRELRPFLHVKKAQANIFIEFYESRLYNRLHGSTHPYTPYEIKLACIMRRLNYLSTGISTGRPAEEIPELFGLTYEEVMKAKRTPRMPFPTKEQLMKLYNSPPYSISHIARLYNVSRPTVRKWLEVYDIPLHSRQEQMHLQRALGLK